MHSRLQMILLATACFVAACSDSTPESAAPSSTAAEVASTTPPPSSTAARSLGGYNVTPLRSDAQRVTFRLAMPDGAVGEVALSPPETTISLVEPSIDLMRPDGLAAGGGGIFTAAEGDSFFSNYCASTLGGNCTPKSSDPLADGNRFETFMRTDGGTISRVVFGPWAMFVQGRDVADAFTFHSGTYGFPVVAPRTTGYSTKNSMLRVHTAAGSRYLMQSDPLGTCTGASTPPTRCDRGLSIEPVGLAAEPSVKRVM